MPCWLKTRRLALILLSAFIVGCRDQGARSRSYIAPDFQLKDLSGKTIQLKQYLGHPVLLDFWATWCAPCVFSIPSTQKFYEKNKDKGLVVLGLNMNEDPSEVFAFVNRMKMTYPVLYAGNSNVPGLYGLEGLPLFIVIDAKGQVVRRYDGFSPEVMADLEAQLTGLLSQSTKQYQ